MVVVLVGRDRFTTAIEVYFLEPLSKFHAILTFRLNVLALCDRTCPMLFFRPLGVFLKHGKWSRIHEYISLTGSAFSLEVTLSVPV